MKKAIWFYPEANSFKPEAELEQMKQCGVATVLISAEEPVIQAFQRVAGSTLQLHAVFGLETLYARACGAEPPEAKVLDPEKYRKLYAPGQKPYRLECWAAVPDPAPLAEWLRAYAKRHPYLKGIHVDALRFSNTCFFRDNPCNCDSCRKRRAPWLGKDLFTAEDERDPSLGHLEAQSKIEIITRIARMLAQAARKAGKEFSIAARTVYAGRDLEYDPPPTWGYGPAVSEGQDWPAWCREGILDGIHFMNYTPRIERFKRLAQQHKLLLKGTDTSHSEGLGISSSAGKITAEIFGRQIEIMRELEIPGLTIFGWKSMDDAQRDLFACA